MKYFNRYNQWHRGGWAESPRVVSLPLRRKYVNCSVQQESKYFFLINIHFLVKNFDIFIYLSWWAYLSCGPGLQPRPPHG